MKTVIWMPTFRKSEVLISAENEIELPFQLPALESEAELKALGCSFKGMQNISDHQKNILFSLAGPWMKVRIPISVM